MVESSILEEFQKQYSGDLVLKVANYIKKRLGTVEILKSGKQFVEGCTVDDIISQAIEHTLNNWDFVKHPDLFLHLLSVVNTMLYNHFHSFEFKNRTKIIENSSIYDERDSFWDRIVGDSSPTLLAELNDIKDKCYKVVENDPELSDLLLYYLSGCSRKEISADMDITVKEVDNMMKRLRRKLETNLPYLKKEI